MAAREVSLLATILTWKSDRELCCPFHAGVADVIHVARMMEKRECNHSFPEDDEWQCRACGILDIEYKRSSKSRRCNLCKDMSEAKLTEGYDEQLVRNI